MGVLIEDLFLELSVSRNSPLVETFFTDDEFGSVEGDFSNCVVDDGLGIESDISFLRFVLPLVEEELRISEAILQWMLTRALLKETLGIEEAEPAARIWTPSGLPQSEFTLMSSGRDTPFDESLAVFDEWIKGYAFSGLQVKVLINGVWMPMELGSLLVGEAWKGITAINVLNGGTWKE
jgi:hypothetical protein